MMKKIFLMVSLVALVAFMAGPAAALVGMPDDVPGSHILGPYFLVSIPGVSTAGDNTLIVVTETGGQNVIPNQPPIPVTAPPLFPNGAGASTWDHGLPRGATGTLFWCLYNQKSDDCGCDIVPYTRNDVVPINMYDVIVSLIGAGNRAKLEIDLEPLGNPDGINDHWFGYIKITDQSFRHPDYLYADGAGVPQTWRYPGAPEGTFPDGGVWVNGVYDHLIGHMYQVDLLNGQATGTTIPAREYAPRADPPPAPTGAVIGCVDGRYRVTQNSAFTVPYFGLIPDVEFTDFEVFTGWALRETKNREKLCCADWRAAAANVGVPRYFRLMSRYFLYDPTYSENLMFLWTNGNWGSWDQGGPFNPDNLSKTIDVFRENEDWACGDINIPWELNIIDVRQVLPTSWMVGPAVGGWFDIRWDYLWRNTPFAADVFPDLYPSGLYIAAEWLGYSWQLVDDTVPAINWSVSYPMHREAGQLVNPLLENALPPPCY